MSFNLDLSTGVWTDTDAEQEPEKKPGRPPKVKVNEPSQGE